MTRIILTLLLTLPLASLLALDRSVYATLENELETLVDGAGDVWAYSGNGGYAFKFEKDVSGGPEKELFINFSVRPNVWRVFAGENNTLLGDVGFASFDFIHSKKEGGQTRVLRSYSADSYAEAPFEPFGNYVFEKHITDNGIESKVRKVGVNATQSEFTDLRLETESENFSWAKPAVQAIALKDLLLEPDASWFEFNPDEAQVRNGYYRLPGDEARTSAFESTFTPKVALEALNQKLGGVTDLVDKFGIEFDFNLYFAVRTVQDVNASKDVFTQRGKAAWEFDGSGTINAGGVWTQTGSGNTGSASFTEVVNSDVVPVTTGTPINTLFGSETWTTENQ